MFDNFFPVGTLSTSLPPCPLVFGETIRCFFSSRRRIMSSTERCRFLTADPGPAVAGKNAVSSSCFAPAPLKYYEFTNHRLHTDYSHLNPFSLLNHSPLLPVLSASNSVTVGHGSPHAHARSTRPPHTVRRKVMKCSKETTNTIR